RPASKQKANGTRMSADDLKAVPATDEITPEPLYLRRREFLRDSALFTATSVGVGSTLLWLMRGLRAADRSARRPGGGIWLDFRSAARGGYALDEASTPYEDVTTYNNFYEFGVEKSDPVARAQALRVEPWTLSVEGEVAKPQTIGIDQLVQWFPLEERV